ncbi:MAG TPA: ABC transporter ATP-binding protein [Alphaproteobacteria bacterium]
MTQHGTTALSVRGVSISYGRRQVINKLDLEIKKGDTFGLIGLNGVGKTTLIKTVLGLRNPDAGDIRVFGDIARSGGNRKVAYLPERFEPPSFLSGKEFLEFSLKLYGITRPRAQIEDAAGGLMLDPAVLKSRVQTYSKGMRQKLGLLSVLLTDCPLLILDEPMSGLDPRARALVKDVLGRVRKEGRTIMFSSHILADMNEICDDTAVLSGGAIIFIGTPAALCAAGGDGNIERAFLNLIDRKMAA